MSGQKKRKEKRPLYKRKGLLIFGFVCLLIVGCVALFIDAKLEPYREQAEAYDLANIDKVKEPSIILDRHGLEIGRMFSENRDKIPIEEVPQLFVDALLAQEDQRFFIHDGVDWVGVARAVYLNVKSRGVTQGAGTITMQLARNAFDLLGEARRKEQSGYERKMVEAFLALRIEKEMMKQFEHDYSDPIALKKAMKTQLLEFYVNRVPFGSGYYGIRAASLGYFGKEPKNLELHECASIVACVKNPSRLTPLRHPETNKIGRDHVIRRMSLEKMISIEERDRLLALPVVVNPKPILRGKSYLYEKIEKVAREKIGEEAMAQGGFVIKTTIDLDIQNQLETVLRNQLDAIEEKPNYQHARYADFKRGGKAPEYLQGAALLVDHQTGEALAHIGGRRYAHSQYDFLELGRRPLGTAFFPFIYAAALERGETPATMLLDEQMNNRQLMVGGTEGVVGEWGKEILDPEYEGEITARHALMNSKIAATVRLGIDVGLKRVMETASSFGFLFPEEKILNRNLVGWNAASVPEVVKAYSSFANGGQRLEELIYVTDIRDSYGVAVYQSKGGISAPFKQQACSDATAFQIHSMLNDTLKKGNLSQEANQIDNQSFSIGVKTGTPYRFADAWAAGYNGKLSCAVWIGFHKGSRKPILPNGFAKDLAFPVLAKVMNLAGEKIPSEIISKPPSVEEILACRRSGQRVTRYCNEAVEDEVTGQVSFRSTSYKEYFKKGTKVGICSVHGAGLNFEAFAQEKPPRKSLPVVPIKSKSPLLLGFDPYDSEKPSLAPEDVDADKGFYMNDNTLVVEDRVKGEKEALLRLPRPPRFELPHVEDL